MEGAILSIGYEHWLSPLAILLSASVGAGVAVWSILTNRRIARLNNSMNFINNDGKDEDIRLAIKEVNNLINQPSNHVQELAHKVDSDETKHIRKVLNYYESMAVCIEHKIYDDEIIKQVIYTTVTNSWDACLPYVKERRKLSKKTTFFQEAEKLVERWKNKPLKPN
jgi:hypothetical protein